MHNPTICFNVFESLTQHLLFISYAQIAILPTYFHGYLLFITSVKQLFYQLTFMVFEVIIVEKSDRKSIKDGVNSNKKVGTTNDISLSLDSINVRELATTSMSVFRNLDCPSLVVCSNTTEMKVLTVLFLNIFFPNSAL